RRVTNDDNKETHVSLGTDGEKLVMAYLKTRITREDKEVNFDGVTKLVNNYPTEGQTDLYIMKSEMEHDVAVDSLSLADENPVPGPATTITAKIVNNGDAVRKNVTVAFYDGNNLIAEKTVTGNLVGGGNSEVTCDWTVPNEQVSHTLRVIVDPNLVFDDKDRENNTATLDCVLPDLTVNNLCKIHISGDWYELAGMVVNDGVIPSAATTVEWTYGESGEVFMTSEIGALQPGESVLVDIKREFVGANANDGLEIKATVDSANEIKEFNEDNNSAYQTLTKNVFECASVSDVKQCAPSADVTISGKIVTAVFDEFIYIEEPDRTAGIRVYTTDKPAVGAVVTVTGNLLTGNEVSIYADSLTVDSAGEPLKPLAMHNPRLGGNGYGSQFAVGIGEGLNNIGLLVKSWGRVTYVGDGFFYMDDGTKLFDGSFEGITGVRVESASSDVTVGDYVSVTGISSCIGTSGEFGIYSCVLATEITKINR
ncbi:MAG: hypothetical protein J6332_06100, partial [Abditibacteriota bacterium]|nr:hypothetical protein [Abditibacteriota bacterium]